MMRKNDEKFENQKCNGSYFVIEGDIVWHHCVCAAYE